MTSFKTHPEKDPKVLRVSRRYLQIGCQRFPLERARMAFNQLLNKDYSFTTSLHPEFPLVACRRGVKFQEHVLAWADVERVWEEIQKTEKP